MTAKLDNIFRDIAQLVIILMLTWRLETQASIEANRILIGEVIKKQAEWEAISRMNLELNKEQLKQLEEPKTK